MPNSEMMEDIRRLALAVPGARDVEKCFARKIGLRYYVDLHLEVDPDMSVRESHYLGHQVRDRIVAELEWVAEVLVHVEPYAAATIESGSGWKTGK
jgi:divalent metal cation (Fe/Co/Zn/Cd) transporter